VFFVSFVVQSIALVFATAAQATASNSVDTKNTKKEQFPLLSFVFFVSFVVQSLALVVARVRLLPGTALTLQLRAAQTRPKRHWTRN
jgi:hypothetical protein